MKPDHNTFLSSSRLHRFPMTKAHPRQGYLSPFTLKSYTGWCLVSVDSAQFAKIL